MFVMFFETQVAPTSPNVSPLENRKIGILARRGVNNAELALGKVLKTVSRSIAP